MTKDQAMERMMFLRARTVENGCTENEANIAMQALNALMSQYNLSMTEAEIQAEEMMALELEGESKQPIHGLCNSIGYYTDTQNWYEIHGNKISYKFLGLKEDVLTAQYLFAMLNSSIGFELRKYKKGKGRDKQRDDGFVKGMCFRLSERLSDMKRESVADEVTGSEYAIVVRSKKQRVNDAMAELGISLRVVSDKTKFSMDAFDKGYKKGGEVQINKGISDNPQGRKQLR